LSTPRKTSPAHAVALKGVGKQFGTYVAVRDATFAIPTAGFVSIIGPSGCGKSTVLNMIAGLSAPTAGTIEVFGEPIRVAAPAHDFR
jgi:ABC-type Fe3+/spermidine/putrescine transport system ATPase subunit